MPFPQADDKHSGRPYVTPHQLLDYRASQGMAVDVAPESVIVTWQGSLLTRVKAERDVREIVGPAGAVLELAPAMGFARLPIGAPIAAVVLEELAAAGTKVVVGVGTAGAISDTVQVGDVVICTSALRDEGTSHHYAPSGRWAYPDESLVRSLHDKLPHAVSGPTWTTDAPYRETIEEITSYRQEGVLTVDMEAAALFTVGACLEIRTASLFCISDVLHGPEWSPQFNSVDVNEALWALFRAAETACSEI